MKTRTAEHKVPGTIDVKIQIPKALHEAMKLIREARSERECSDVKLRRIYRESIEQFVNAKPQQQLLKEYGNATGTGETNRSLERIAARM